MQGKTVILDKKDERGEQAVPELYAAPLEGVTTHVWRQAHRRIFGGVDKYYTPFLSPNSNRTWQPKELRELTAGEPDLVPQLITNRAEHFIWGARELQAMGYGEVNFNLGCPSGTVVAKRKGAGLLTDPAELDDVLRDIFTALPELRISVKTRIGRYDAAEWPALLAVFEKYPIHQLTVHPRVQKLFYTGTANRALFRAALEKTALSLVYNGDVTAPDDEALTWGCPVMIGRGLIADPALCRRIRGGPPASREELTAFHDALFDGYTASMGGPANALHRMRELWNYLSGSFIGAEPHLKRIRKARTAADYVSAARAILTDCPLRHTT